MTRDRSVSIFRSADGCHWQQLDLSTTIAAADQIYSITETTTGFLIIGGIGTGVPGNKGENMDIYTWIWRG